MEITNKENLPQPLFSAIVADNYDKVGDISVSQLIKSPRQRALELRHDEEITVDASTMLWLLLGNTIHAVLERADTKDHLVEERLTMEVNGWVVSGKRDLLGDE